MSNRTSFYRKIAYLACMAVLLFPLTWLSMPRTTQDNQGGKLAQLRSEHELGQVDLGEIDPASETMKLATVGLRGVAVNLLWGQAMEHKKKENWSKFTATLDQLSKLQPNFITFWKYQSWNQSYNLSVEFDDYRDRYYYVRRGIEFLEEGEKYNRDNPQIQWELGWFIGQKIGRADERDEYRRLFKADEEYHDPRGVPVDERDNWQVSKQWYLKSVEAADVKERGYGRKSPIVFYSSAAKSQMNYAEAIEEDGLFDTAEREWATSEREWRDFGNLEISHSTGVKLRLGAEEELTKQVEAEQASLGELAPDSAQALMDAREASLTDDEAAALKTEPTERDSTQWELARLAERKLLFQPRDLAKQVGEDHPELRRQAAAIAAGVETLERELNFTRSYKQTANYDYWLTRAEFEQTEDAIAARQLIFRGKQAFKEELDPIKAKELYKEGLDRWAAVFEAYPVLLDQDGTTGDDVFVYIRQYDEVLAQLEEDLPLDPKEFLLWDVVRDFDSDRLLTEEYAAHVAWMQANGGAAGEATAEEAAAEGDSADEATDEATDSTEAEPANEPAGEEAAVEEAPADATAEAEGDSSES